MKRKLEINPNRGLMNYQINNYLKNVKSFRGTFPLNKIPKFKTFPSSVIVNSQTDEYPGAHWLAVYINEKKQIFYFDSFGLGIIEYRIHKSLSQYNNKYVYNKVCIQDVSSISCGLYCIAFIKKCTSETSFNNFINKFSNVNLLTNENIVLKMI